MKPIAKLMLVAMLLFWARRAQATTYAYCYSDYSTCMTQCYVPWSQATEYCPHSGTLDQFCMTAYEPISGGTDPAPPGVTWSAWAATDECMETQQNSCLSNAAGNLAQCIEGCASSYCTPAD